jgi:hypothetical protein
MKIIQIFDENKYNDEDHYKTALDTFVDIDMTLYNWLITPFSEYSKSSFIKYQTNPEGVKTINGRYYLKGDFMQFSIQQSPKSKIWNSYKCID